MKFNSIIAVALAAATLSLCIADDAPAKANIHPVSTITVAEGTSLHEVTDGEVRLSKNVIREFAIGEDITVAYKNITDEGLSPKYVLQVFNRYGFLLGEKSVGGGLILFGGGTYLEPGELGGEKIYMEWVDFEKIFANSNYTLPSDFSEAKWITLSESNTSPTGK